TNLFVVVNDDEIQRIRVGHVGHSGLALGVDGRTFEVYTELSAAVRTRRNFILIPPNCNATVTQAAAFHQAERG
ncbi:MAG TPA: hypothetical protein VIK41_15575, partial [Gemmatimonadaceae bacterium]